MEQRRNYEPAESLDQIRAGTYGINAGDWKDFMQAGTIARWLNNAEKPAGNTLFSTSPTKAIFSYWPVLNGVPEGHAVLARPELGTQPQEVAASENEELWKLYEQMFGGKHGLTIDPKKLSSFVSQLVREFAAKWKKSPENIHLSDVNTIRFLIGHAVFGKQLQRPSKELARCHIAERLSGYLLQGYFDRDRVNVGGTIRSTSIQDRVNSDPSIHWDFYKTPFERISDARIQYANAQDAEGSIEPIWRGKHKEFTPTVDVVFPDKLSDVGSIAAYERAALLAVSGVSERSVSPTASQFI